MTFQNVTFSSEAEKAKMICLALKKIRALSTPRPLTHAVVVYDHYDLLLDLSSCLGQGGSFLKA
jgi:hypothetical protein